MRIMGRSNRWLLVLVVTAIASQLWLVFHATDVHSTSTSSSTSTSTSSSSLATGFRPTASSPAAAAATSRTLRAPRVLIGIMGNANNHIGKVYRDRHRRIFQLWNDSRLCFLPPTPNCQIVYTFVLGGHNGSSTAPPYHLGSTLDDQRPLTLDSIPTMPRFKDVVQPDVTILNIRENMNDGKTPTFFHWATRVARQYQLDYIMKCDSDAFLRWKALLRFVHRELPWPHSGNDNSDTARVPWTVLGNFRHKAYWTSRTDETIWQQEWYQGMHLYLAGQLYMMSVDVAEHMVQEARRWYTPNAQTARNTTFAAPYFAGHEDHDAISMIQQQTTGTNSTFIRWMSFAKHFTFWEHPVKGEYRWQRILAREEKQRDERLQGKRIPPYYDPFVESTRQQQRRPCSLMVIVLPESATWESAPQLREEYWDKWKRQEHDAVEHKSIICSIAKYLSSSNSNNNNNGDCELYYVFVVGTNPNGPTEVLTQASNLRDPRTTKDSFLRDDVWYWNIQHNIHQGMGTTILYWIDQQLPNYRERLDCTILMQYHTMLNWTQWKTMVQAQIDPMQTHPAHLVVGEVRDKYQEPREFPTSRGHVEAFWYQEFDNIHLYLGSDCITLSTSLIAGLVEQAQTNEEARTKYLEGNLGHDLTMWAYLIPKTILQWIPITKSQRFWYSTLGS